MSDEPAGSQDGQAAENPWAVIRRAAGVAMVVVIHQGGPHHRRVRRLSAHQAEHAVVYDRDLSIYERANPPRTIDTTVGPAQVWVCIT